MTIWRARHHIVLVESMLHCTWENDLAHWVLESLCRGIVDLNSPTSRQAFIIHPWPLGPGLPWLYSMCDGCDMTCDLHCQHCKIARLILQHVQGQIGQGKIGQGMM